MGLVLEAARIIKDFIPGKLAVEVFSGVAVITRPGGCPEGVVLDFNGGGPGARPVPETADTGGGDFRGGIRVKGYLPQR